MTPEELDAALRSGDPERVLAVAEGASEAERRAAAPLVGEWRQELAAAGYSGQIRGVSWRALAQTVPVATMATGTLEEVRKHAWGQAEQMDDYFRVLVARRPPWLASWAEWAIRDAWGWWTVVHRLAEAGAVPPPSGPEHTLAFMREGSRNGALSLLRTYPSALPHVWSLFEVEGGGDTSLSAVDKFSGGDHSWGHALLTLSAEGVLPRERLLDASLEALARDFEQFRAGWHSRFHELLAPTPAERAARLDAYLGLLSSRIAPTVSFAVKALTAIQKAGVAPPEALIGHLGPALAAREKGTALGALRLLAGAVKSDAALAPRTAQAAVEALSHAAPDVQAAAVELIRRHGRPDDLALREAVRDRLEDVSATVRPSLSDWLGEETTARAPEEANAESGAELVDALEPWATLAGVPAARAALEAGDLPPALELADPRVPRLAGLAPLLPLVNVGELLDAFSAALENAGPPDDLERVLDGVSRLCAERPVDFERRAAPLLKRARKLWVDHCPNYQGWVQHDLACLALAWLGGEAPRASTSGRVELDYFPGGRVAEVALRVARRAAAPLVAAPTHVGGWIAPEVLVHRALAAAPEPLDGIQALLRLAPDGRAAALPAAAAVPGAFGVALRFALGGPAPTPLAADAPEAEVALWVAAARARDPRGAFPDLHAQPEAVGPDGFLPGRMILTTKRESYKDRGKTYTHVRPTCRPEPPLPRRRRVAFPTVLHYAALESDPACRRWLATCWPGGRHAWFAAGVDRIANNLDWWGAEWENRVHLEALLEPDTDLGENGRRLLALGLAAKEPGEAGLAVDALLGAVEDGRLCAATLGAALADLAATGLVKPPRWARTLGEAARASALHREVVRGAVERLLAAAPDFRPADLGALLELQAELCALTGGGVATPAARDHLTTLATGGGKAAALAKGLLALPPEPPRAAEAARVALQGRLARAFRWSAAS